MVLTKIVSAIQILVPSASTVGQAPLRQRQLLHSRGVCAQSTITRRLYLSVGGAASQDADPILRCTTGRRRSWQGRGCSLNQSEPRRARQGADDRGLELNPHL